MQDKQSGSELDVHVLDKQSGPELDVPFPIKPQTGATAPLDLILTYDRLVG